MYLQNCFVRICSLSYPDTFQSSTPLSISSLSSHMSWEVIAVHANSYIPTESAVGRLSGHLQSLGWLSIRYLMSDLVIVTPVRISNVDKTECPYRDLALLNRINSNFFFTSIVMFLPVLVGLSASNITQKVIIIDFDEIFSIPQQWYKEQLIILNCGGWSGSPSGSRNCLKF